MPRPTIADVARKAQVSRSTVDRILAGRDLVRPETAARVLKAAEEIGFYGASALRQRLRQDAPHRRFGIVLQQEFMPFHHALGTAFRAAAEASRDVRAEVQVEFCGDLKPDKVASKVEALGRTCDAVAIVMADHPLLTRAIDGLRERGIPVFAAVSELSAEGRTAYIGVDNRKLGRTAAWFIAGLNNACGKVAIIQGSHRHLEQEQREMGFRSFLREHAPELNLLEPFLTHESDDIASEVTSGLLTRHPDLTGLFVAGGGINGVLQALGESGKQALRVVAVERTPATEKALLDGRLVAALSLPIDRIAGALIGEMVAATTNGPPSRFRSILLPFEVNLAETI